MKKRILCLLIGVTMLFSVGCGKKEEEIDPIAQDTIDKIETLGDITLDDEDMIVKLEKTYSEMTEKQKNQVKNYIDLKNAREELDELKKEQEEAKQKELAEKVENPPYSYAIMLCNAIKESCYNSDSFEVKSVIYFKSSDYDDVYEYMVEYVAQNKMGGNASGTELAIYDTDKRISIYTEEYKDYVYLQLGWTTAKEEKKALDADFIQENLDYFDDKDSVEVKWMGEYSQTYSN